MKNILHKLLLVSTLVCFLVGGSRPLVLAENALPEFTTEDLRSINQHTSAYDPIAAEADQCSVDDSGTTAQLSGDDMVAQIFNYLIGKEVHSKPLKDFQVVGILGNMQHESAYQPQRLQGTPSGSITTAIQAINNSLGWGLVQWTPAGKMIKKFLKPGVDPNGQLSESDFTKDPNSTTVQLDFLLEQLSGGGLDGDAGQALVDSNNAAEATLAFETGFERHKGDPQAGRIVEAERILDLAQSGDLAATGTNNESGDQAVIALDPGHGGAVAQYTDSVTGLGDRETANSPESQDVQEVADQTKTQLETAGYKVIMLKERTTDAVNKRARVDAAKAAGTDLAISFHTTPPSDFNQVWPQFVGGFRASQDDSKRVTFSNQAVADESNRIAGIMAQQRTTAEGHTVEKVVGQASSFSKDRGLPSYGDLSLVQLWATDFPWVYNEFGTDGALTSEQKAAYATGIVNAVKQALPTSGADAPVAIDPDCRTNTNGDVVATALLYAWPEHRDRGTAKAIEKKPVYEEAVQRAKAEKRYTGGTKYPGVDCGGFVTIVMYDSGFDKSYNCDAKQCAITDGSGRGTAGQLKWARDHWQKIGKITSTDQLQPGDVAFKVTASGGNAGHTFMWVGEQPGFQYPIASASWDERAPMAGEEQAVKSNIEWYRKR